MAKGFRSEADLWTAMRPKMLGKWMRVENVVEEGFFDLMGSYKGRLIFVERKIADAPDRRAVEPGQIDFGKWMMQCGHDCYFVWGGRTSKNIMWTQGLDFSPAALRRPEFWRGQ